MASPTTVSYSNSRISQESTGSPLSTNLTVTFQDLDGPELLRYSYTPRVNTLGGTLTLVSQDNSGTGTVGFVTYNYSVPDAAVKGLKADQVVYQVFTVTATDSSNNSVSQDVVVTITGTNDAPIVGYLPESRVAEGSAAYTLNLLSGASDPDTGTTLRVSDLNYAIDNGTPVVVGATSPSFLSLNNSILTVRPNDPAFDNLGAGTTRSVLLNYLVSDGQGGNTAQSQTIVITGTNDAPRVATTGLSDSVAKGTQVAFDLLRGASDVDASDNLYLANVNYILNGRNMGGATPEGVSLNGTTLSVDGANAAFSSLYSNQSSTVKVNYQIKDSSGAFVDQSETITINGSGTAPAPVNRAPIVSYLQESRVAEGSTTYNLNLLSGASDLDTGATLGINGLTYSIDGAAGISIGNTPPTFLSLNNALLTIRPTDVAFDSLASGSTRSILLNYMVTDGQGGSTPQSQTIVITGTNDAPRVTTTGLSDSIAKGTQATFDLLRGASDVDASDNLYLSNVNYILNGRNMGGATPEGVSLNGTTLSVDGTNAAFSSLYSNQSSTIKVNYQIKDSFGAFVDQSDTITINGSGSAPTPPTPLTPSQALNLSLYTGASITGSAMVGNTLTANISNLGSLPTDLSYQWLRDGIEIGNATNNTYVVNSLDTGHLLRVDVKIAGTTSVTHHFSDPLFGYA